MLPELIEIIVCDVCVCVCMCICVCECWHAQVIAHIWKTEDNLQHWFLRSTFESGILHPCPHTLHTLGPPLGILLPLPSIFPLGAQRLPVCTVMHLAICEPWGVDLRFSHCVANILPINDVGVAYQSVDFIG